MTHQEWLDAPMMTVEEIRDIGHRWIDRHQDAGGGATWMQCSICGAICPSDSTERPSLFRKTGTKSLLTEPHK